MSEVKYGIQMYSVRDLTEVSLREALKKVAELGYRYIEFAGFFGNSAEDVKNWLDEYGLICSGTHTGIGEIAPDKIDGTIKYHKTLGCKNLIVPGCDWSTPEKCNEVINTFNFAQKKLAENGIRLGYHNHSQEFFPTADGIVFEDEVLERTDIEVQIDTFWLYNAGIDVIDYLEKHKERISVIHLKDGIPSAKENKNFDMIHTGVEGFSLGEGSAPVTKIRQWAIENNVLMVVESEGLKPSGIEEVKRCIDFLETLSK